MFCRYSWWHSGLIFPCRLLRKPSPNTQRKHTTIGKCRCCRHVSHCRNQAAHHQHQRQDQHTHPAAVHACSAAARRLRKPSNVLAVRCTMLLSQPTSSDQTMQVGPALTSGTPTLRARRQASVLASPAAHTWASSAHLGQTAPVAIRPTMARQCARATWRCVVQWPGKAPAKTPRWCHCGCRTDRRLAALLYKHPVQGRPRLKCDCWWHWAVLS